MSSKKSNPAQTNSAGKHDAAWRGFDNSLMDRRQQRFDFLVGQVFIHGTETSTCPAIFVLQANTDGSQQKFTIDAFQ